MIKKKIRYLLKIITNNEHYIWRLELFFKNMDDINPAFIMPQNNVIITFIRSRRLILNFELSYILILFFSLVLDWFQNLQTFYESSHDHDKYFSGLSTFTVHAFHSEWSTIDTPPNLSVYSVPWDNCPSPSL